MKATLEDYTKFMDTVSDALQNPDFKSDPDGLVRVSAEGDYELNLQFVAASSKILAFVQIAELPPTAGKEVYRALLAAGLFGKETAGGNFALEPETNAVIYSYLMDFDPETIEAEPFIRTLENVISLSDLWANRLIELMETEGSESAPASEEPEPPFSEFGTFRA